MITKLILQHLYTSERRNYNVLFIYSLLNRLKKSPDLLGKILLVMPFFNLTNIAIVLSDFHTTNYNSISPLDRTLRTTNNINNIDKFHCTVSDV